MTFLKPVLKPALCYYITSISVKISVLIGNLTVDAFHIHPGRESHEIRLEHIHHPIALN